MEQDIFWELFRDTGDPLCWLMTRPDELTPPRETKEPDRAPERPLS